MRILHEYEGAVLVDAAGEGLACLRRLREQGRGAAMIAGAASGGALVLATSSDAVAKAVRLPLAEAFKRLRGPDAEEKIRVVQIADAFAPLWLTGDPEIEARAEAISHLLVSGDLAAMIDRLAADIAVLDHPAARRALDIIAVFPPPDLGDAEWIDITTAHRAALEDPVKTIIDAFEAGETSPQPLINAFVAALEAFETTETADDLRRAARLGEALLIRIEAALAVHQDDPPEEILDIAGSAAAMMFERAALDADATALAQAKAAVAAVQSADLDAEYCAFFDDARCVGLALWFEQTGDAEALEEAIAAGRAAVAAGRACDSPFLAAMLNNLSNALCFRYENGGADADLAAMIQTAEQAIAAAEPDDLAYPIGKATLAEKLIARYLRYGALSDLTAAIDSAADALDGMSEDAPEYGLSLSNLSVYLSYRYQRFGSVADLEEMVDAARSSVRLAPAGDTDAPRRISVLAAHLTDRYERFGDESDLREAVEEARRSAAQTTQGDRYRAMAFNNLSCALAQWIAIARNSPNFNLAVFDEAIDAASEAVRASRGTDPNFPTYLNNEALRYADRDDGDDLDRAVTIARRAVNMTSPEHPERSTWLQNLSVYLAHRYEKRRNSADAAAMVDAAEQAAAAAPVGHPERALMLGNLAGRYEERASPGDLERAAASLRAALAQLQAASVDEARLSVWSTAAATETRRLATLLIRMEKPEQAVEAIEAGAALRLRADSARAGQSPSDPAQAAAWRAALDRDHMLRAALQSAAAFEIFARGRDPTQARIDALKERADLAETLRGLAMSGPIVPPPPSVADIQALARRTGPIAYLFPLAKDAGTLWILLHDGALTDADWGVDLALTSQRVFELLFNEAPGESLGWASAAAAWRDAYATEDQRDASLRAALEALRPTATALARRLDDLGADAATLIAGGRLGLLPLHAAPTDDGVCLIDRAAIAYAPSAAMLAQAAERPAPAVTARAGVFNPAALGLEPLPFAALQGRLALEDGAIVFLDDDADKDALQTVLAASDVEIAAHASFVVNDPGASAVRLAGGAAAILADLWSGALSVQAGARVTMAACETAVTDPSAEGAEERIGFPSALLAAGAKTVVGALWSVEDVSTTLLLLEMRRHMRAGASEAQALRRACIWMRALTAGEAAWTLRPLVNPFVVAMESRKAAAKTSADSAAYHRWSALGSEARRSLARLDATPSKTHVFKEPYYWAPLCAYGAC